MTTFDPNATKPCPDCGKKMVIYADYPEIPAIMEGVVVGWWCEEGHTQTIFVIDDNHRNRWRDANPESQQRYDVTMRTNVHNDGLSWKVTNGLGAQIAGSFFFPGETIAHMKTEADAELFKRAKLRESEDSLVTP